MNKNELNSQEMMNNQVQNGQEMMNNQVQNGQEMMNNQVQNGQEMMNNQVQNGQGMMNDQVQNGQGMMNNQVQNGQGMMNNQVQNGQGMMNDQVQNGLGMMNNQVPNGQEKTKKGIGSKIAIGLGAILITIGLIVGFSLFRVNAEKKKQNDFAKSTIAVRNAQEVVYSPDAQVSASTYSSTEFKTLQTELDKLANSEYDGGLENAKEEVAKIKETAKELRAANEEYFDYVSKHAPVSILDAKFDELYLKFSKATYAYKDATENYVKKQSKK